MGNRLNSGQPSGGQVLVRYESGGITEDVTTAANGSAYLTFNTGDSSDDSDGTDEFTLGVMD